MDKRNDIEVPEWLRSLAADIVAAANTQAKRDAETEQNGKVVYLFR